MPRATDAVSTGTAGSVACSANATPTASAAAARPGMTGTRAARDRMDAVRRGAGTGRDYPSRGSILVPRLSLVPFHGVSVQTLFAKLVVSQFMIGMESG
jgi:hypothetical protein